jgi:hypothetical protein
MKEDKRSTPASAAMEFVLDQLVSAQLHAKLKRADERVRALSNSVRIGLPTGPNMRFRDAGAARAELRAIISYLQDVYRDFPDNP